MSRVVFGIWLAHSALFSRMYGTRLLPQNKYAKYSCQHDTWQVEFFRIPQQHQCNTSSSGCKRLKRLVTPRALLLTQQPTKHSTKNAGITISGMYRKLPTCLVFALFFCFLLERYQVHTNQIPKYNYIYFIGRVLRQFYILAFQNPSVVSAARI